MGKTILCALSIFIYIAPKYVCTMPKSKCIIWNFTCYMPKFIIEICIFLIWYAPIGLCYGQSYIQHVLIQWCLINLHMLNVWIFMDAYLKTYMYVWYSRLHLRPLVIVTVELHVSSHDFSLDPTFMTYLGSKNTWDWILLITIIPRRQCSSFTAALGFYTNWCWFESQWGTSISTVY